MLSLDSRSYFQRNFAVSVTSTTDTYSKVRLPSWKGSILTSIIDLDSETTVVLDILLCQEPYGAVDSAIFFNNERKAKPSVYSSCKFFFKWKGYLNCHANDLYRTSLIYIRKAGGQTLHAYENGSADSSRARLNWEKYISFLWCVLSFFFLNKNR